MGIPAKVKDRLTKGIKRFQPILTAAKSRDDGEADTVIVVIEMLADVFGYDKFTEVTAEYAIRSTYCDLATKIDGSLQTLIEVKAIGSELKDTNIRQAVDYAANQGVDWVVLTNGIIWRVYKVSFGKPIDQELVVEIDFCNVNPRVEADLEKLYLWCKEGWVKSVLGEYHTQKQMLSRFFLAAVILSEPSLNLIRRELKRVATDVRIDIEEIRSVLTNEVFKREVLEGDKADEARKRIARAQNRARKAREEETSKETKPNGATSS